MKVRDLLAFDPGRLVATPGVLDAFKDSGGADIVGAYIKRHLMRDWGDLDAEDKQANDRALEHGGRLLSVYHLSTGVKIYIITEHDRSVTTLLLPKEY